MTEQTEGVTVAERTGELIGMADVARRYKVGRTTAWMWYVRRATSGFPEPVAHPSMGPIFDTAELDAWHATGQGRRNA